ncbi:MULTISPECIES: hypothetical protein [Pseudonocardia]|uniref:N-terminal of MaoC-like dehydratase domain-containing protein n=2 Tax=Pseudonocardia TaxID=1847 RepID=A0A1Y2N7Z6_PSEAH|nr:MULTISPECIES: hypothetical protein [Pseudonocardia]OSY43321.1 hypothetical protein BG845_00926 [Pseudonocardia autotrophica]TDN71809.1 3-methylfumaryl-CoA hydratase [Pseudonocardia autotrophica]BBG02496.1 hypothetical protein Pdca_37050 [Pseudonocardia autotrophica]GEC26923.1 hypothetical protein PSA01_39520 [Pseudonocardia saturnea]
MSDTASLADLVRDWDPPTVRTSRRVDPWLAAAFADLVDAAPPDLAEGAPLPPLWHWFVLLGHPRTAELGEDGHPADGPHLPPVPGRRRMFAGGRFTQHAPIPFGALLHGSAAVASVTPKSGRTGEMLFVTVRQELRIGDDPAVVAVEEQEIVYRSEPEGAQRRVIPRPEAGEPDPGGAWRRSLATGTVLLSRFSALTYNGHRIHHDHPYTTTVEGYPDLVVHGPLMALLALELPRVHAPGDTVTEFGYRLSRPAFLPSTLLATGDRDADGATIAVAAEGVAPSLTATVRFR